MGKSADSLIVEIRCEHCQHPQPRSVGWLKTNSELHCESCGRQTAIYANDLVDGIKKASVVKPPRAGAKA